MHVSRSEFIVRSVTKRSGFFPCPNKPVLRKSRAINGDAACHHFVIAVDIFCKGPACQWNGRAHGYAPGHAHQSCLVAAPEMEEADLLIAPAITVSRMSAKDQQERAIQAGYEAARAALARIVITKQTVQ